MNRKVNEHDCGYSLLSNQYGKFSPVRQKLTSRRMIYGVIFSIISDKRFLQGNNMTDFWSKQICFAVPSPVYNNANIKVRMASHVKLFDFKVTLKWMEVNGMLHAIGHFPGWDFPMGASTSGYIPTPLILTHLPLPFSHRSKQ